MNILLCYYYTPSVPGAYLERALRRLHDVKTCGPELSGTKHHDIPLNNSVIDVAALAQELAQRANWHPDALVLVESPHTLLPKGIVSLPFPTAFYAIDTHTGLLAHQSLAPLFDLVFVAQKQFVDVLSGAGARAVLWLPLACDPSVHGHYLLPKQYDTCFLGYLYGDRAAWLSKLRSQFEVYADLVPPDKMTEIYSMSRIVLNRAMWNDLNMRVFEALSSGSLLVTNRIQGNGFEELFADGQDLVVYDDQSLERTLKHYLRSEEERQGIAANGLRKARSMHTYDHRARDITTALASLGGSHRKRRGRLAEELALRRAWFFQTRFGVPVQRVAWRRWRLRRG